MTFTLLKTLLPMVIGYLNLLKTISESERISDYFIALLELALLTEASSTQKQQQHTDNEK